MKFKFILLLIFCFVFSAASYVQAREYILFSKLSEDGFWQIWMMDTDGSNQHQVTASPEDKRESFWLDHLKRLGYRTANGELFIIDLRNNNKEEILADFKPISNPHYASVTKELVFVRFQPTQADIGDIWKHNFETGQTSMLSKSRLLSFQPRITEDGEKIAFIQKDEEHRDQIWVMESDGTNFFKLTEETVRLSAPELSLDKKNIIFTSNQRNGDFDLYEINVLTKVITPIIEHEGMDTSPAFSSDNSQIVFVSNRSGSKQIWVLKKTDGSQQQLTFGSPSVDPVWVDIKDEAVK